VTLETTKKLITFLTPKSERIEFKEMAVRKLCQPYLPYKPSKLDLSEIPVVREFLNFWHPLNLLS